MIVEDKIQNVFLGRKCDDINIVIMTPIHHIYIDIYNLLNCEDESVNGFYQNAYFSKGAVRGILICSSQGVAAQDVVYLFSNVKIVFIGYAGSLTTKIPVGTPIEVDNAIYSYNKVYKTHCYDIFIKASVAYAPCFLGEEANNAYSLAVQNGASVVDMETIHCAKAADISHNLFCSFLIITDIPNIIDVWNVPKEDSERIRIGTRRVLESLHKII